VAGPDGSIALGAHPRASPRPLVAVAVVAVLADALWLWRQFGGAELTTLVTGVAIFASAMVAVVLTGRRARLSRTRSARIGWLLLCLSEACFALGIAVSFAYTVVLGALPPEPTLADPAYLVDAGLAVVAVMFLGGSAWNRIRIRMLLDGSIVACALLLLSWLTALHAVYQSHSGSPLGFAVGLAYPISDVVTAVVVLSTVANLRRLDPSLLVVGVGMLVFAFSDSAYVSLRYVRPGVLDAGYTAANVLIGVAALLGEPARPAEHHPHLTRWQVLLPYLPLVPAGLVVMLHVLAEGGLDLVSQALAGVSVVLVLARQLVAVLEAQTLTSVLAATLDEQRILIEQAPVGICRLDAAGRLLTVNRSLTAMLGVAAGDVVGRPMTALLHPDDVALARGALVDLRRGAADHVAVEARALRGDGTTIWWSTTAGPLRGADGRVERIVAIVEDVSDRKRALERAASIQRRLLPQSTPEIAGYELAGACLPAQEVAGDFYDWVLTADGCLDLTVADVMGKGIPSALVMAVVRTALRSAPPSLSPVERVRIAAASVGLGTDGDGMFVTLFHARLDPSSGVLRYVDAGHGHCAVRRAGGELVRLPHRSLPLGLWPDEEFEEGEARLGPGDALLVYSDGLIEVAERILDVAELTAGLDEDAGAAEMVRGLMAGTGPRPADDVTVVVLRRQPER
jgi:PAS domain S-box-containing protein